ncbi:MAG: DUF3450 family protein, partial [Oleiharenicola lentus]
SLRPPGPCLALLTCLLPAVLLAADEGVEKVAKLANEWVKVRAETVRLETEWNGQQSLMESMVDAVGQRARFLEEKMEHAKAQTAQDRDELDTLEKKNQVASSSLDASEARLKALAKTLLELRPFLPPRLSAALELPYKSISDPALSLGDRMQHSMTVLNRCMQFNRVVSVSEEVLTPAGESAPKSLEVIYWGLSHGYALDRAAGKAWFGSPGPAGWQWEARPEVAKDVARLIAIATDKSDPDFVVVPAKLSHPNR